jgi:hypothetical protein
MPFTSTCTHHAPCHSTTDIIKIFISYLFFSPPFVSCTLTLTLQSGLDSWLWYYGLGLWLFLGAGTL